MLTESQIAELKAAHGSELNAVAVGDATFVFKRPSRVAYDRWIDKHSANKLNQSEAARELVQSCIVFPAAGYEAMIAALDKEPALLLNEFLDACTSLAGLKENREVKKL